MAKKLKKGLINTKKPRCCPGFGLLPILIIILVWWKPTVTWAKVTITIAAVLILIAKGITHSALKKK